MKITRTIKYNYKLTEESLEKDIDLFIGDARAGKYSWDYKFGMVGLKIIKQYFNLLKEKFEEEEFEECKECYHKLILFLFHSSNGEDDACFGYEDLLDRTKLDWEKILENYFLCMIKTCDIEELSDRVYDYAIAREGYGFDSDIAILIKRLDSQAFFNFEQRMLIKTEGTLKNDEDKKEVLYFLLEIAGVQKNKEKYNRLCSRFKEILKEDEFKCLIEEFEEYE